MDHHTGCQYWQNIEEETVDVAIDLANVSRINEQNIASVQTLKHLNIDVLQALWDDCDACLIGIAC